MKYSNGNSPVGVRIPEETKRRFDEYCNLKGLKKSYLLSRIIEEKLMEFEEDEADLSLAEQRIEEERISLEEFNRYIEKRN